MRDLYYKSGDGFLMVYSITDTSSLEDVKERYQSLLDATVSKIRPVYIIYWPGRQSIYYKNIILDSFQMKCFFLFFLGISPIDNNIEIVVHTIELYTSNM